jgi:predicted nucleic acid-binding protein
MGNLMVLCDTNIFIHAFNGNPATITALTRIGTTQIVLSAITVMELLQGMGNKKELAQMKKKIKYYDVIHITPEVSQKAIELVDQFKLSHGLQIPDAIIGATAVIYKLPLFTYNVRDFNFIPDIILHED